MRNELKRFEVLERIGIQSAIIPILLPHLTIILATHLYLWRSLRIFIRQQPPFNYVQYLFFAHTSPSAKFRTILVLYLTEDNSRHKAPLVVRQQAERSEIIRVMSVSEIYQDNRVPLRERG